MSLKDTFISEANREITKHPNAHLSDITEKDIAHLPVPVQKHFKFCSLIGKPKVINAETIWKDVSLKTSPDKKAMTISCYQFNSIPEPARFAYMKTNIAGLIPFEGLDKFQDGRGNMLIKLLKFVMVGDYKGKEMDESALVTVLAEALFIPSYALQKYIFWELVDNLTAKATIACNGIQVSGIFYFNEEGACLRFETNDRYFTQKDGSFEKIKWTAKISGYQEVDGIKIPREMSAIWNLSTGDYEYFIGKIVKVKYNIVSLDI